MTEISRIPVCSSCLALPQAFSADFFCCSCRTPFAEPFSLNEQGRCASCEAGLTSFDAAYSFGNYEGALRKLIHLFKYAKVESLADPLGRFLVRALPMEGQFDAVMAMPMHWRKQWQRGFNQAELLAAPIARRFGLAVASNLRRTRYTSSQAGLSERERRENLKDSFFVKNARQVAGQRILLVDDVYTTGSTLRAAAKSLKDAGAAHVSVLTLARVDKRSWHEDTPDSLKKLRRRASAAGTGVS